ncbi:ABC transporter permease [Scrofimicrobium sp. R131]|uniref:ABC transporter permease n=1 Tax=Scrofimicrobium appendicitidis TaxID=3079930 RepID=A0AAU7V4R0_9ACTO
MRALIFKEFRELARDHRTLGLLIALPIVLLVIFGYAANFSVAKVDTVVIGPGAEELAERIGTFPTGADQLNLVGVHPETSGEQAETLLRDQEANLVLVAKGLSTDSSSEAPLTDQMSAYTDGSSLFAAQAAQRAVMQLAIEDTQARAEAAQAQVEQARAQAAEQQEQFTRFASDLKAYLQGLQQAQLTGGPIPTPPTAPAQVAAPSLPELSAPDLSPDDLVTVLFNPDLKTSTVMIPGLIGLILLFIGAVITSIGLVREREAGTLEQLAVMPLRPSAIILGKITPYFLLSIFDLVVITALGVWIFQVPFVGPLWLFGLTGFVYLFVVLGIGVLVSSFSQTTGQAIQMAIMFAVPQVLLSGLIFPLSSMPIGVRWIGYLLPLTWYREVAMGVMLRGAGVSSLWLPLLILTGMAVVIFTGATARMHYALTHGGTR